MGNSRGCPDILGAEVHGCPCWVLWPIYSKFLIHLQPMIKSSPWWAAWNLSTQKHAPPPRRREAPVKRVTLPQRESSAKMWMPFPFISSGLSPLVDVRSGSEPWQGNLQPTWPNQRWRMEMGSSCIRTRSAKLHDDISCFGNNLFPSSVAVPPSPESYDTGSPCPHHLTHTEWMQPLLQAKNRSRYYDLITTKAINNLLKMWDKPAIHRQLWERQVRFWFSVHICEATPSCNDLVLPGFGLMHPSGYW